MSKLISFPYEVISVNLSTMSSKNQMENHSLVHIKITFANLINVRKAKTN